MAVRIRVGRGDGPIAYVFAFVVGAEAVFVPLVFRTKGAPEVLLERLQRPDLGGVGQKRENMAAGHACGVLEKGKLIAVGAVKNLHFRSPAWNLVAAIDAESVPRGERLGIFTVARS